MVYLWLLVMEKIALGRRRPQDQVFRRPSYLILHAPKRPL